MLKPIAPAGINKVICVLYLQIQANGGLLSYVDDMLLLWVLGARPRLFGSRRRM